MKFHCVTESMEILIGGSAIIGFSGALLGLAVSGLSGLIVGGAIGFLGCWAVLGPVFLVVGGVVDTGLALYDHTHERMMLSQRHTKEAGQLSHPPTQGGALSGCELSDLAE